MEKVLEKLRAHTKEITDILFQAQSSLLIVRYLYIDAKDEEREIISQNRFLQFAAETYWRRYVTEMSKLLCSRKTEHFNLQAFIEKFQVGGEFESVKAIDEHSLQIWQDNLTLEAKQIENLVAQRDKHYSHTDSNRHTVKNALSYLEAEELLNVIKRVVSEIHLAVFEQYFSLQPFGEPVDDLKRTVISLLNLRERMIDDYRAHCLLYQIDPKDVGLL